MTLIADSGSTKTAWLLRRPEKADLEVTGYGINPVRDSAEDIGRVVGSVAQTLEAMLAMEPDYSLHADWRSRLHVFFYGAGCIDPFKLSVAEALERAFSGSSIEVESDLLGAARALCGHGEGIACILGTGANSCLYDGTTIVANTPALGWILGDEGSGAVLGRTLVSDALKGQLGEELRERLLSRFALTQASVIDAVYRQPQANRFLASLVPFIVENRTDERIHALLERSFRAFFRRNVKNYDRRDLPVHFVGGVAAQFTDELTEAADSEGFTLGVVERSPIYLMADFHS